MTVFLTTDRLVLRRFTDADAENLVDLDSDPEVMFLITGGLPTPREQIVDVVLPHFLAYYERSSHWGFWAAQSRTEEDFLGWFHLRPGDGHPDREPELGYRLRRSAWGLGYATEGSRALVDYAFTRAKATRVLAETMAAHTASRRVMEKSGMRLSRTFTADWPYPIPGDEHGDVEYVITRREWEQSRG